MQIFGTTNNDLLTGTEAADEIRGRIGNDTLRGLGGDDWIIGGWDNDLIEGGSGNDRLDGDDNNQSLDVYGNDTIYGNSGNDELLGGRGYDVLYGGDGDDFLNGWTESNRLYGESGDDTLIAVGPFQDYLDGGPGNDRIRSGQSSYVALAQPYPRYSDIVVGGGGSDVFIADGLSEIDGDYFRDFDQDDLIVINGPQLPFQTISIPAGNRYIDINADPRSSTYLFFRDIPDGTFTIQPIGGGGSRTEISFRRSYPLTMPPAIGSSVTLDGIRDYDGNQHGLTGTAPGDVARNYKYQGRGDLNNDGKTEEIYTNRASGRWATLQRDPLTGSPQYNDHGFGGITRVVGIYIDPLVAEGEANGGYLRTGEVAPARFGPFDSQRRFQNDLLIDNLIFKSSGDYDGDGFQEVYWKVADGTAYLRAIMHADGNIQYANYQSEEQMLGYLRGLNTGDEEIAAIL